MTDKARETIAALVRPAAWEKSSQGDLSKLRENERLHSLDNADAILAALPEIIRQNPSIIADMVEPLEWEDVGHTSKVSGKYTISERSVGCFLLTFGGYFVKEFSGGGARITAIEAANAHSRATILKALGTKEGE